MSQSQLPYTTLCTVGTSLVYPNLVGLPSADQYSAWLKRQPPADQPHLTAELVDDLKIAFEAKDWMGIAEKLADLPANVRLCGAELNSIHDLEEHGFVQRGRVVLLHSDTDDGRAIAEVLAAILAMKDYEARAVQVDELRDDDPRAFRTHGLRNLARQLGKGIRDFGRDSVAINATGGYKAQIAVAVLIGQALGVPVYYKHERFSEIIAFPPMPVALDLDLWLKHADLFHVLNRRNIDPVRAADYDIDERLEPLLERVEEGSDKWLDLSATGQIFHETFRDRFSRDKDRLLPAPATAKQKSKPQWENAGHMRSHPEILALMQAMTDGVPYVVACSTHYYNPDLPESSRVRQSAKGSECVFSNGSWTVKWRVDTTASTPGQTAAAVADLNDWLESRI